MSRLIFNPVRCGLVIAMTLAVWPATGGSLNPIDQQTVQVIGGRDKVEKCTLRLAGDYIWMRVYPGETKGPFRFKSRYNYTQISLRCRPWKAADGDPTKRSLWTQRRSKATSPENAAIYFAGLSRLNKTAK